MSQCQPCCRVGSYFLMGACAAAWCADPALRMNAVQAYMNIITTALISLDLSWVQDQIRQNESTGYSSLTRALVFGLAGWTNDAPAARHEPRGAL